MKKENASQTRTLAPAPVSCIVCGHTWTPRTSGKPKRCANCKTPYWEEGDSFHHIADALSNLQMAVERLDLALGLVDGAIKTLEEATGVSVA